MKLSCKLGTHSYCLCLPKHEHIDLYVQLMTYLYWYSNLYLLHFHPRFLPKHQVCAVLGKSQMRFRITPLAIRAPIARNAPPGSGKHAANVLISLARLANMGPCPQTGGLSSSIPRCDLVSHTFIYTCSTNQLSCHNCISLQISQPNRASF